MSVGDTHTIQALNSASLPVTGLTWVSSNPDVVSLSTGDPPILTALAAGRVTIFAGTASADVTVFAGALPLGTVIWSNPGDGSGVNYIVPAVPSTSGVADVFAFQADGTVQAITSDGTVAWTADLSQARYALPDFQGGLAVVGQLLAGQSSIYKLDGTTGQPYPAYTASGTASLGAYGGSLVAVHPDGTIFAVQQNSDPATYSEWDSVIGIDPTTGAQKFSVDLHSWPGFVWDIMIAGDGYAYVVSSSRDFSANTSQLYLLRVNSSGAYDDFGQIAEWPGAGGDILDPNVGMITNADQGILLTWSAGWGGMALTAGTGVSLVNPPTGPGGGVVPILQAQDGSFVGSYYNDMIAFDASGTARWIVANETPQIATADGGVTGKSGITYDQYGNATGQMFWKLLSMPAYSWIRQWYSPTGGMTDAINLAIMQWATSYTATAGGNPSSQGTAVGVTVSPGGQPVFGLPNRGPGCQLPAGGGTKVPLSGAALTQFHAEGSALMLGNYLTSPSCSTFFTGTPLGANYLDPVSLAVIEQVPYDAVQSNISMYDAGMSDGKIPLDASVKKNSPVCGDFVAWHNKYGTHRVKGITSAESQISVLPPASGPATDIYINTAPSGLALLTQGTILHEALHNLTGLYDFMLGDWRTLYGYQPPYDLKTFVGIEPIPGVDPSPGSTHDITIQLVTQGCAGAN